MDDKLTKDHVKEPIQDFVKLIKQEAELGAKPTNWVLNFRDWQINNQEKPVYKIKHEHLRFRKDNGRIASDVESYEMMEAPLQEESKFAQDKLREFLEEKNPDRIKQLMSLLKHSTQQEPAIITCDGFLVNGNRRKLALEKLFKEEKSDKYLTMKVVILPENATIKEIEQVENRYQYHSDGKDEYTNFDKALSIRRKERNGITLEMQLLDDPEYYNLTTRQRTFRLNKVKTEFLGTLECIDVYLKNLDRKGGYRSIAEGPGDRDGRWEAFMTFHKGVFSKLGESKERAALNVNETEAGKVVDAAFKIIRKRELKTGRLNDIMRKFPKMLLDDTAKKELLKLANDDMKLTELDITREGKVVDEREQDKIWGGIFGSNIINQVKKAKLIIESQDERERPIDLLKAALKKLDHDELDLGDISPFEINDAMEVVEEIQGVAEELYKQLDKMRYKFKQLRKGKEKN